ncbi:hypothetical protein ACTJIL_06420 [Luteimonas sp. 22616]|uniref:hypothetical protein n=1 Tax=Luteimonas sp. 22616 TaxID=3453951 RepID=UPI003F8493D2
MRRQITADELATLYHEIGACIWHMQYLEDALHNFLTMKVELRAPGLVEEQEALALLAKHRRATLGTALRTAETSGALPAPILLQLRALKEERDWLVHRSMHQDGNNLYTDHGRGTVFDRLSDIQSRTFHLKEQIVKEIEAFCTEHGISSSEADEAAKEQVAALRGEG